MKKTPGKKGIERRKKSRGSAAKSSPPKTARKKASAKALAADGCFHCAKSLSGPDDKALFVEEEIGRIFCSEECIAAYFAPEIERLEKEFYKRLSSNDLSGEERESLAHLRWITLQEADEVWREKTLAGDYRYTLISEFQPGDRRVWSICICLFLRGEPSFLYLAFTTRNQAMVNYYRRGERVQWVRPEKRESVPSPYSEYKESQDVQTIEMLSDRLATDWTEDETYRAQTNQQRTQNDIPVGEFHQYQKCLEETLEEPDEVWSLQGGNGTEDGLKVYHFIRYYSEEEASFWYVIIARETEEEEQIEILDAFPTNDQSMVDRYRRGEQEVGTLQKPTSARMVH